MEKNGTFSYSFLEGLKMSAAVAYNKIMIFCDITLESYDVNFNVGNDCEHSFLFKIYLY